MRVSVEEVHKYLSLHSIKNPLIIANQGIHRSMAFKNSSFDDDRSKALRSEVYTVFYLFVKQ
ncbi:hypothetical protein NTHiID1_01440 [Haemophilus influenzae]|nr:hypothetical protein CHBNIII6_16280 [Haemophilus influenzae]GBK72753.1 hypothetical protein NTHiID1_01440 [Haemophilus influenzae]